MESQTTVRSWHWRCARAAFLALVLGWLAPLATAEEEPVRLWIDVRDDRGRLPEALQPGDVEVLSSGVPVTVESLAPASASRQPVRIVLYFDRESTSTGHLKRAASALASLAEELVALGEVEVVMAAEEPNLELRSRDALVLGEHLSRLALTGTAEEKVLAIRKRALRDLRPATALPALGADAMREIATVAVSEELELGRRRQEQLLSWLATPPAGEMSEPGPRLLFWITDGFDLDPVSFFAQHLEPEPLRAVLQASLLLDPLEPVLTRTSRALAGMGWTVMPVAFVDEATEDSGSSYTAIESRGPDGSITAAPGISVRPGSLFRRRDRAEDETPKEPEVELVDPLEPLATLAEASGGEIVVSVAALGDALRRFGERFELVFRPREAALGELRTLAIRGAGDRYRARGVRWASRGLPSEVARLRLASLLSGAPSDGGFDVAAVVQLRAGDPATGTAKGNLEARLDLRDLEAADPAESWTAAGDAVLRVSVASPSPTGELEVHQEIFEGPDLEGRLEWLYRTELDLAPETTEVAVLVEELGRGLWGGLRATMVEAEGDRIAEELLPPPDVIEILRPDEELLRGRVKFEVRTFDPAVARVVYLLDDREVATENGPPFDSRIDLGRTPRKQNLAVIAYDRSGVELGRDRAVINGGSAGLTVEIVSPENTTGTGPIEVLADISVPLGRRLDRVLFFWNNENVAVLYAEPFRHRVTIPEDVPVGYLRVVAMLDDGTVGEDVLFMNGPTNAEQVDVNLVELYVVVTDRQGRPVRGLELGDFVVREEGETQEISTFSSAEDLPLTLGMAIDSSASMFVKLPGIQQAAIDFLHSTFSEQDRVFVVDFDSEPRLVRTTTNSLQRVEQSIDSLEADGRTALWESIAFSLVQLQGVRGRKALIVFSDGADEDDRFPFRSLLDVAKRMGVPIYLILARHRPEPGEGGFNLLSRSFESRVNRLTEATGGRVFYGREYATLGEVYEEIERELRSQYLLTYYPSSGGNSRWRSVDVEVIDKELEPRTLSGYWP